MLEKITAENFHKKYVNVEFHQTIVISYLKNWMQRYYLVLQLYPEYRWNALENNCILYLFYFFYESASYLYK